ncbi:hypothetical protein J2T60_002288 [Natronospira proteinivora]|uniref:Uncharacterized protein n=1 Tax=Natronospira proteinivora TaxID=1807133 RepID=A0ABT1GDF2_9GAMM|nr:delta-60 repeat domain-containing protein [Natronospira proteinivora]MCP1728288.1 hypothetical protein [Natronospira proteinivora]
MAAFVLILLFTLTACSSGSSGDSGGDDGNGGSGEGPGDGDDGGGGGNGGNGGEPVTYPVGGQLSGFVHGQLTLSLNDSSELTLTSNGGFLFPEELEEGEDYLVELIDHSMGQACTLSGEQGPVGSDAATAVAVDCSELALEAVSGDRAVSLAWSVDGLVDILYSSDLECDWNNVSSCENGGHIPQVEDGSLHLSVHEDDLLDDQPYTFVLSQGNDLSRPAHATPIRHSVGGTIYDAVMGGEQIFIGGNLSAYHSRARGVATYQTDHQQARLGGAVLKLEPFSAKLTTMVEDPNGGWFVAGNWSEISGHSQANIARLHPDGSVDTEWQANLTGYIVYDMVVHQDRLYLGGWFDSVDDPAYQHLVALNLDGSLADTFQPEVPNSEVHRLVAVDDQLFVAGDFDDYGPDEQSGVVALEAETGAAIAGFAASANGPVRDLLIEEDRVVLAGGFDQVNGEEQAYLAAVDRASGALDEDFAPELDDDVWALYPQDDQLIVAGYFREAMGVIRRGMARLDRDSGALDESWDVGGDRLAHHVTSDGEYLYVSAIYPFGFLGQRPGYRRYAMASGEWDEDWLPEFDDMGTGTAAFRSFVHGNQVTLGGRFSGPGSPLDNLVALDLETGLRDETWLGRTSDTVRSLLIDDDTLYVGGEFVNAGQERAQRRNGAAFDRETGDLLSWRPETDSRINTMALSPDGIYLGGNFAHLNTHDDHCQQSQLAFVDKETGLCIESGGIADVDMDGRVEDLAWVPDFGGEPGLIVTGLFNEIYGETVRDHAVINSDTQELMHAFETERNRSIHATAYSAEHRYQFIGGNFEEVEGQDHQGFFGYSDDTELDLSTPTLGFTQSVRALQWNSDKDRLLLGGRFSTLGNENRSNFAAMTFDGSDFVHQDNGPTFEGHQVNGIKPAGEYLLVFGSFDRVNGDDHQNFVVLDAETLEPI